MNEHNSSTTSGYLRRIIWAIVMAVGVIYSTVTIYQNSVKYFSYPSSIKPMILESENVIEFPKITVCPNGLHSRRKLQKFEKEYGFSIPEGIIKRMYTGLMTMKALKFKYGEKLVAKLDEVDYEDFLASTSTDMAIIGCKYLTYNCTGKWNLIKSPYGECIVFESAQHFPKPTEASAREAQLSFMIYNDAADTMGGFNQLFTGLTMFFSSSTELTLDPLTSISLSPGQTPIVAFRQVHELKLGKPYSDCVDSHKHKLKIFGHYTPNHCISECMADKVYKTCNCTPVYLATEESLFNGSSCSLLQMTVCVLPQMKRFNYTSCDCGVPCSHITPEAALIQYGKSNERLTGLSAFGKDKFFSALAYMQEVREVTNLEIPDYISSQYLSDTGGAAGLFLGMSVATILGALDCSICYCIKIFSGISTKLTNYIKTRHKHKTLINENSKCVGTASVWVCRTTGDRFKIKRNSANSITSYEETINNAKTKNVDSQTGEDLVHFCSQSSSSSSL